MSVLNTYRVGAGRPRRLALLPMVLAAGVALVSASTPAPAAAQLPGTQSPPLTIQPLKTPPPVTTMEWCSDDPILVVGNRTISLKLSVPAELKHAATASSMTVTVPPNVKANLAGVNSANFPIALTLVRSGPNWTGAGPIPVTVTGVVSGLPAGTPTRLTATDKAQNLDLADIEPTGTTLELQFGVTPLK